MPYPTDEEINLVVDECRSTESGAQAIKRLILKARIEEADGFDHGNEAWSGNMNDDEIQSDSPVYNYQERLRKEMESL